MTPPLFTTPPHPTNTLVILQASDSNWTLKACSEFQWLRFYQIKYIYNSLLLRFLLTRQSIDRDMSATIKLKQISHLLFFDRQLCYRGTLWRGDSVDDVNVFVSKWLKTLSCYVLSFTPKQKCPYRHLWAGVCAYGATFIRKHSYRLLPFSTNISLSSCNNTFLGQTAAHTHRHTPYLPQLIWQLTLEWLQ